MFFFIAGIQPRTITLNRQARMCPSCGYPGASLKRVDHYLSLFFIPLFPVKRGSAFLACDRCNNKFNEQGAPYYAEARTNTGNCPGCGKTIAPDYFFCPHCGKAVREKNSYPIKT